MITELVNALAKRLRVTSPKTIRDIHEIVSMYVNTRPHFKALPKRGTPWLYEVWDISSDNKAEHFPIMTIDTKGASENFHQKYAEICAKALNFEYGRVS